MPPFDPTEYFELLAYQTIVAMAIMGCLGLFLLGAWKSVPVGTRSVLIGAHCWCIHPWFVALAWWKLYGFRTVECPSSGLRVSLWDPRLWLCFAVHDLGYWGKPNMDGPEGERHPEIGARIVHALFDWREWRRIVPGTNWPGWPYGLPGFEMATVYRDRRRWHDFVLYHSRFLAKRDARHFSLLCPADKLACALTPAWLYVPMARLSGEIREYRSRSTRPADSKGWEGKMDAEGNDFEWFNRVRRWCRAWAFEHRDGRIDTWTPAPVGAPQEGARP